MSASGSAGNKVNRTKNCSIKRKQSKKQSRSESKRRRNKDEYEVEQIIDYEKREDNCWYLVKWRGWKPEWNSWEPFENLENSHKLLIEFWKERKNYTELETVLRSLDASKFDHKMHDCYEPTKEALLGLLNKINSDKLISNGVIKKQSANFMKGKVFSSLLEKLMYKKLFEYKSRLNVELKAWQDHINSVSGDAQPIMVENLVDFEGPPKDFTYINDYIAAKGIVIPDDPLVGCECPNCTESCNTCCPHQSNTIFAYDKYRKLQINHGTPIYECNKRCKCGSGCRNRVVQQGRKAKLCIFRTANNCGWGVKALEFIRQDTFVTEYVGEVITNEEAERRGKQYDSEGRTYLFDLDYNDRDDPLYTVDAAYHGNISHFINHSCEPNLAVFAVWINCIDPNLPRIALFADRDIQRGEELTFDYMSQSISALPSADSEEPVRSTSLTKKLTADSKETTAKTECKCGSKKCRKYLF